MGFFEKKRQRQYKYWIMQSAREKLLKEFEKICNLDNDDMSKQNQETIWMQSQRILKDFHQHYNADAERK